MQYRFDALFLDREGKVRHIVRSMKPFRCSRLVFSARAVLELPDGTIEATSTELGDLVRWSIINEPAPG